MPFFFCLSHPDPILSGLTRPCRSALRHCGPTPPPERRVRQTLLSLFSHTGTSQPERLFDLFPRGSAPKELIASIHTGSNPTEHWLPLPFSTPSHHHPGGRTPPSSFDFMASGATHTLSSLHAFFFLQAHHRFSKEKPFRFFRRATLLVVSVARATVRGRLGRYFLNLDSKFALNALICHCASPLHWDRLAGDP